jgi:hypothetical protein
MSRVSPARTAPSRSKTVSASPADVGSNEPAWSAATRVAFRFSVLYLGLFVLATQISGSMLPNAAFYYRGLGRLWPLRDFTMWVATHVFGASIGSEELTANGEPLFFWVQTFWILIVALAGTAVWSFVDRSRREYARAYEWFRLFIRFALAASMFEYGMTKVIPTQFPAPSLETLVTPAGDLTLSAMLWTSIGASPAYQIFTGCVEILGAVLLVIPRTVLLGALVTLAAATQVFVLNMTFDIGLKLISFHLVLLALFLLAPDLSRLANLLLWNRPASPRAETPLWRTARARRLALFAQLAIGVYLLGMYTFINVRFWQVGGGGRPRSALYGIWNIEQMSVDGVTQAPVLNDYDRRWRRAIFDEPDALIFQRTDDTFAHYDATIDTSARTFDMRKSGSRRWRAQFSYEQPSPDRLRLDGTMDGHRLELKLRQLNPDTLRLLNSRFRWVRMHEQRQ